jgi:hypothetical protein
MMVKKLTHKQKQCAHLFTAKVKTYKRPCRTGDVVSIRYTCAKCKVKLANKVIKPYSSTGNPRIEWDGPSLDDYAPDGRKSNE